MPQGRHPARAANQIFDTNLVIPVQIVLGNDEKTTSQVMDILDHQSKAVKASEVIRCFPLPN